MLFAVENPRSVRYGILRVAQTDQTNILFACVPSCGRVAWLVDRSFMGTRYDAPSILIFFIVNLGDFDSHSNSIRWSSVVFRFAQLFRALCDVWVLLWVRLPPRIEAKHLPEEIDYANANCKCCSS